MNDYAATPPETPRKPRIALMGEFSAGKSTLTNLLIGGTRIPMRVTATQLPPVWLSHGTQPPYRETLDGSRIPIEGETLDGIPVEDTAFIRLFVESEVLEVCDIIDTPGISDPNMPPEVWQRAAAEADAVLWLTHAGQAWRQSEAAVWAEMPEELWPVSLLLVTRIDKVLSEHDRARILARLRREAGPMFHDILPISLTQALAAGDDDADLWTSSGGEAFSAALLQLIESLKRRIRLEGGRAPQRVAPQISGMAPAARARPLADRIKLRERPPAAVADEAPAVQHDETAPRGAVRLRVIAGESAAPGALPRRVVRLVPGGSARPERSQD